MALDRFIIQAGADKADPLKWIQGQIKQWLKVGKLNKADEWLLQQILKEQKVKSLTKKTSNKKEKKAKKMKMNN